MKKIEWKALEKPEQITTEDNKKYFIGNFLACDPHLFKRIGGRCLVCNADYWRLHELESRRIIKHLENDK
jgi:hypothetical protein